MSHAFSELYLEDAIRNMGEMVEYVDEYEAISVDEFFNLFIKSGYSKRWKNGDPCVIAGMSGTELHHAVMRKVDLEKEWPPALVRYYTGDSYWCGYILAYYQWKYNLAFSDIFKVINYQFLLNLYPTMHTISEEVCVDIMHDKIMERINTNSLQVL